MKKCLALILALLMVVPMFGCAATESKNDLPNMSSSIIPGEELNPLATPTTRYSKTVAADNAYVRSGKYADQVMEPQTDEKILEIKNNSGDYRREILLRFDLTKMTLTKMNRVQILLNFRSSTLVEGDLMNGREKAVVVAYGISNKWSSSTVTFNNAPIYDSSKPVGEGDIPLTGICVIDVTDYVFDQYDKGATSVSFRLAEKYVRSNESKVFSTSYEKAEVHPVLRADYCSLKQSFVTDVYQDAADNQALWDYAQELYDDFYVRYQEILNKGDYKAERIVSNPLDFSVTTQARGGTPTASLRTFKTRLMTTLSGYKPSTTEESLYGGDLSAKRQEATGRYYTKVIDGRWWVIDPLGYPCYVRGINHIHFSYQGGSPYQQEKMLEVYGSEEKWAIAATRWVQNNYHMNVAAARHVSIETVEDGLSYTFDSVGISDYAEKLGIIRQGTPMTLMYNNSIPVFDPEFATFIEEKSKQEIEAHQDKTRVFGYSTDNEIVISDTILSQYLTLDYTVPANIYSYATAWTFYKNITGVENPKLEDIEAHSKRLGIDLQDLFQGFVYDRYHKVLSTAIKSNDPDGLYLGARSLTGSSTSEWYLRFTGYWCDIYCVNYYSSWEIDEEILYNIQKWLGKPMLITEFYAKAMDAESPLGGSYPNTDGAGWVVETQEQRGEYYQNFCLRLLESKACIGWLYFQYIDNDPHVNPTASNKGMVNCDHDNEVYEEFNKQIALINENVYGLIKFFDKK